MKTNILYPLLSLGVLTTSCVAVGPDTNADSTHHKKKHHASSEQSDAGPPGWQAGYEKGLSDGRGGRSRTPSRYDYLYSQADRKEFFRGYESGYNRGIRP